MLQHDVHVDRQEDTLAKVRTPGGADTTKGGGTRSRAPIDSARDNLTYLRIVEQVTSSGISQKELGYAVGASPRSVQNWVSGEAAPRSRSRKRLLDVKYIVDELQEVYTREGVDIWLHSRNRNLGGQRPIELLTAGNVDEVVDEAQRLSGEM
jgi:transcriptional regulator with XRE-family HTH domain